VLRFSRCAPFGHALRRALQSVDFDFAVAGEGFAELFFRRFAEAVAVERQEADFLQPEEVRYRGVGQVMRQVESLQFGQLRQHRSRRVGQVRVAQVERLQLREMPERLESVGREAATGLQNEHGQLFTSLQITLAATGEFVPGLESGRIGFAQRAPGAR